MTETATEQWGDWQFKEVPASALNAMCTCHHPLRSHKDPNGSKALCLMAGCACAKFTEK